MSDNVMPRFQVVPVDGEIEREVIVFKKGKGKSGRLFREKVREPGGYMVYFPSGASMHCSEDELERLGFDKAPGFVDMESGEEIDTPQFDLRARSIARTKLGPMTVHAATG